MSKLDSLQETVGLAKCDRCGFTFKVAQLVEEEQTGLVVCTKCVDNRGFNEMKGDATRDSVTHHFTT